MAKRLPKQAGYPWLVPYLIVRDGAAARDFYRRAFGLEPKFEMPGPDGKLAHVEMTWHDQVVMFGPECPTAPAKAPATTGVASPVGLYLYCDDVDALCARATAAGAKVVSPPETKFYGDRSCALQDPDGHLWSFATNVADFDPSKTPQ